MCEKEFFRCRKVDRKQEEVCLFVRRMKWCIYGTELGESSVLQSLKLDIK